MPKFISARLPWQKLDDPARRIESSLDDRAHRLMAGISLADSFDQLNAALLVTVGHGKYLRVKHIETATREVPDDLRDRLVRLQDCGVPNVQELSQLATDLSLVQAALFERLKCRAGKYVDRILALAVTDPGLRLKDFDGRPTQYGLCDAANLCQLTGVTVIDDFHTPDMIAGGDGRCLDALPQWLLFADRAPVVAVKRVVTLNLGSHYAGYWLPASDGLDAELPDLRKLPPVPGLGFLDRVAEAVNVDASDPQVLARIFAEGQTDDRLFRTWDANWEQASSVGQRMTEASIAKLSNTMLAEMVEVGQQQSNRPADCIRTAIVWVLNKVFEQLHNRQLEFEEIQLTADSPWGPCLVNRLLQMTDEKSVNVRMAPLSPNNSVDADPHRASFAAVVAALLGLLHVDQMPANVPFVTGAREQRLLGRLTPGRPANWRQLLRHMSDFQPPAMKLRDAV